MKKRTRLFYLIGGSLAALALNYEPVVAQDLDFASDSVGKSCWTMDDCIAYALEHSNGIKRAELSLNTAKMEQTASVADFFPSLSASASGQFSWGRNIDPETNTYKDVTTFGSGYGLYTSLTIFDGGQTVNRFRQARLNKRASQNSLDVAKEDKAIEVMMAFADVVYYQGAVSLAEDKRNDSEKVYIKTQRQEEIGVKSLPDVAQARAQFADDEYQLVHLRNTLEMAKVKLWNAMFFPISDNNATTNEPFVCDTSIIYNNVERQLDDVDEIFAHASCSNPRALKSELEMKASKMDYRIAQGNLLPSISLGAGISTNYFKSLSSDYVAASFRNQFKNNFGQYVGASLNIPIFSNLSRMSRVKRAKNNWHSAILEHDDNLRQLYSDILQAVRDRDGFAEEIFSLENKCDADQLAYSLNKRKYEEGMLSVIDLQISANQYYNTRLSLLQKRMLFEIKNKLVEYYKK